MSSNFRSSPRPGVAAETKNMRLESLANELLLDSFEYLTTKEILRAFHNLNRRFNTLLTDAFKNMGFDFRSLSKRDVNVICQTYLPLTIDRTRSLRLIDTNSEQSQTYLIPFNNIALPRFRSLQSLSFFKLRRADLFEKIMLEVVQFRNLTQLNFVECYFRLNHEARVRSINTIWKLPRLTHCRLDLSFENENHFTSPTIVSPSLGHLVIDGPLCRLNELASLLNHTRRLRYLYVRISPESDGQPALFSLSSLTKLRLSINNPPLLINELFQSVPQLSSLTVETTSLAMNGHVWKRIISQFLPKLEKFRLKMDATTDMFSNEAEEFLVIPSSFHDPFWLEEHQWFIRVDYYQHENRQLMCLYTLPYDFSDYHVHLSTEASSSWTSTEHIVYPYNYESVETLHCDSRIPVFMAPRVMSFPNVRHLHINLPCNASLLSLTPKFNRLRSLNITLYPGDTSLSLQVLLKRARHLQSLTLISYAEQSSTWLVENKASAELRCVDLLEYVASNRCSVFDEALCFEWMQYSLARQCEVLSISVQNRFNILQLFQGMANLQTLIVRSEDDPWGDSNYQLTTNADELLHWLKARLPSTYTIQRDPCSRSLLRVWES